MKIIADRAAAWRAEVECSECKSLLEVDRGDVVAEVATEDDRATEEARAGDVDLIYLDARLTDDAVFLCHCPSCGSRLLLDPESLPNFLLTEALGKSGLKK